MFSTRPEPVPPGPGQESVWDYPRPPRLEPVEHRLVVVLGGDTIADTTRGFRVLETSHPPNYYLPPDDIVPGALEPSDGRSFCEFKGRAHYFTVRGGDRIEVDAAWGYDRPSTAFEAITGHVAFYPARMDACFVDGELVTLQDGGFYGGWITPDVVGPFKGGPGSRGW
ncbi:MAG: DUF427 domain-containing protein [Actinomycetota bacterium]